MTGILIGAGLWAAWIATWVVSLRLYAKHEWPRDCFLMDCRIREPHHHRLDLMAIFVAGLASLAFPITLSLAIAYSLATHTPKPKWDKRIEDLEREVLGG